MRPTHIGKGYVAHPVFPGFRARLTPGSDCGIIVAHIRERNWWGRVHHMDNPSGHVLSMLCTAMPRGVDTAIRNQWIAGVALRGHCPALFIGVTPEFTPEKEKRKTT